MPAFVVLLLALAGSLQQPDGEVGVFEADGTPLRYITGLDRPSSLRPSTGGSFLLVEEGGRRIVERDASGTVTWSWAVPAGASRLERVIPAPGGTVLAVEISGGLLEIERSGRVIWSAAPAASTRLGGAVRLIGGSTLVVLQRRTHRFFLYPPGGATPAEVDLPLPEEGRLPGIAPARADGSELFVWEPTWNDVYRLAFTNGNFRVADRIPTSSIGTVEHLVPDGVGGFAFVDNWRVGRFSPGAPVTRFQPMFEPVGVSPAPDGRILVAYIRVPDTSWPESRPKPNPNPALRVRVMALWLLAGGCAAAALVLLGREEGKPTRFLRPGSALALGSALVAAGSLLVAVVGWNETRRGGLWLAVLAVLFSLVFLSKKPGLAPLLQGRDFLWMLPPLGVGAFTIGYRLTDIPANTHFDYVYYVLSAWDLMQGRCASLWEYGFVPAPVFGLLPEVLGLAVAGPGALGFRLGAALVGLSGIVAVFVLGTAWRDRRTGCLAALFLAGGIPWIHFSRMSSTGEAATAALWTLAFFAVAVRTGRDGAYVMAGMAAGLGFYLWPGARTGLAACLAAGAVLALRSPAGARRNRRGAALMTLALFAWLAPLVPVWTSGRGSAMPRAAESLTVWQPGEVVRWDLVAASLGRPLRDSAGWFFRSGDNSTHGTLGPVCNAVEATLFVAGLLLALGEGLSLNLLLLAQLGVTLLVFGAWATNPPWSPRLLAAYPIAALLMARAVVATVDLAARLSSRVRTAAFAAAALLVLAISPAANFRRYFLYETGRMGDRPLTEMTAIGRRLKELGPGWHDWLVTTKRFDWNLDPGMRPSRLGELLPFIWDLHVSEIRSLPSRLPLPSGERAAVVVQAERFDEDVAVLRAAYPRARVEEITGLKGERLSGLVLIEPQGAGRSPESSTRSSGIAPEVARKSSPDMTSCTPRCPAEHTNRRRPRAVS